MRRGAEDKALQDKKDLTEQAGRTKADGTRTVDQDAA